MGTAFPKDAKWIALMVLVAAVWGATFPLVKDTLNAFDPFALLSIRFGIAAAALGAYMLAARRTLPAADIRNGAVLGIFLFVGYAAQTIGLEYTSATESAFVTNLLVILVPVLSAFLLRKSPSRKVWLASFIALIGLWLMSGATGGMNIGNAITLVCAFGYSLEIIYLGKYAGKSNALNLAFMQIAVVALLSLLCTVALGQIPKEFPASAWAPILFLALAGTIFAQAVQAEAQKRISPPKIALILITEPVFAALFGLLLLGEVMTGAKMAGALLILVALFMVSGEGEKE
ncbi:MAG: DMT family transporter [Candidatus Micrarchaeota archaeon]|nr:DMT family transporter [Candidatus Micrarchaeota archaeon]